MAITRAQIDAYCAALPGARLAEPPDELLSWKVGEKMFACFGDDQDYGGVAVKTPDVETAGMLIEVGVAERARYFHRSWVWFAYERSDAEEVLHRLGQSYDLIRATLKKAQREALPPRQAGNEREAR